MLCKRKIVIKNGLKELEVEHISIWRYKIWIRSITRWKWRHWNRNWPNKTLEHERTNDRERESWWMKKDRKSERGECKCWITNKETNRAKRKEVREFACVSGDAVCGWKLSIAGYTTTATTVKTEWADKMDREGNVCGTVNVAPSDPKFKKNWPSVLLSVRVERRRPTRRWWNRCTWDLRTRIHQFTVKTDQDEKERVIESEHVIECE